MTLASYAALFTPALANFDVYMVDVYDRVFNSHSMGWQVFEAQPSSCDEVSSHDIWWASGDVSGDKTGVRCSGSGCNYKDPADNIDVLEMNFHSDPPVYHWTLYKDRGRTMVGCEILPLAPCYDDEMLISGSGRQHVW